MTETGAPPDLRLRWALVLLGIALLAGALLRLPALEMGPPGFHSDEAYYAQDAVRILGGARPVFLEENNGRQALFSWTMAPVIGLLGNETGPARLAAALWGLAFLPAAFLLVREAMAGRTWRTLAAALTVLLLAVLFYHVFYSRVAFRVITFPTVLALACWALLWAMRRDGWWRWVLAGLLAGLAVHTYLPGYAVLPLLLLAAVPVTWRRHGWRRALAAAGTFSLAWLAVAAPLLWHFATAQQDLVGRPAQVTITAIATGPLDLLRILGSNTVAYLGMFAIAGDTRPLNNIPGAPALDPFTLALVLAGLAGLATGRLRGDATWLVVVLLPAMLLPGILTWENLPHAFRVLGVLVPLALLLAAGWSLAASLAGRLLGHRTATLLAATGTLAALALGGATAVRYWLVWVPDPRVQQDYSAAEVALARALRDAPAPASFAGLPPQGQVLFRYLAPAAMPGISWLAEGDSLMPAAGGPGSSLVLFRNTVPLAAAVIPAPGTAVPAAGPETPLARVTPAEPPLAVPPVAAWPSGATIASLAASRLDPGGSLGAGWTWLAPPPHGTDTWLHLVLLDPEGAPAAARAVRLPPQAAGAFTWHEVFFDPVLPPGTYTLWIGLGADPGAADQVPQVHGGLVQNGALLLAGAVTILPDTFPQTGPPVPLDRPLRDASLGGLAIAGSRAPSGQLLPGTTASFPVYLRRTGPGDPGPLTVEIRQGGEVLASTAWIPFGGRFPFPEWTPLRLYQDRLAVPLPRGAGGPVDVMIRSAAGPEVLLRRLDLAARLVETALPPGSRPLGATAEGGVRLAAVAIQDTPAATVTLPSGQPLDVLLAWEALDDPATSLRQFLHLRNAAGETVAQVDRLPRDGSLPTTAWQAGEIVSDRLILPTAGLPPGTYQLVAGVSDLDRGRRSVLAPGNPDGTVTIGTIILTP